MRPPHPQSPKRRVDPLLIVGIAGAVAVIALVVIAALTVLPESSRSGTAKRSLQFRKVLAVANPACPDDTGRLSAADADRCYRLGDGMTVHRVRSVELRPPGQSSLAYSVDITLRPDDAARFRTLTTEIAAERPPRNRLAIVLDGKVASVLTVMEPIAGGTISIEGNLTRADAQRYVDILGH